MEEPESFERHRSSQALNLAESLMAAFPLERLVADAVAFERVSTVEFPANREKNRDFFDSEPISQFGAAVSHLISEA
jgi:hypothetical protein